MSAVVTCRKCGHRIYGKNAHKVACPACETWPSWACNIRDNWREPEDTGLGDSFEHMTTAYGIKQAFGYLKLIGIKCGCEDRKKWMNRKYPYLTCELHDYPPKLPEATSGPVGG